MTNEPNLDAMNLMDERMEPIILLARGLMHELNNALVPTTAYPDLLLDSIPPDSPMRTNLEEIRDGALSASGIVRELQTIIKCGANLDPQRLCLSEMVEHLLSTVEVRNLRNSFPNILVDLSPGRNDIDVKVSKSHFQRALYILLRQSLKIASANSRIVFASGRIRLKDPSSWDPILAPGTYAFVQIRHPDRMHSLGAGSDISKSMQLERSFAYGIFRDHGGSMRVQHGENGASITGYLPLIMAGEQLVDEDQRFGSQKKTILIVDAVPCQRKLTSLLLEDLGYNAVAVSSRDEALQFVRDRKVDLMLLDVKEAGDPLWRSAYESSREMHPNMRCLLVGDSKNSVGGRLPVEESPSDEALLAKPYRIDELDDAVREALSTTS